MQVLSEQVLNRKQFFQPDKSAFNYCLIKILKSIFKFQI